MATDRTPELIIVGRVRKAHGIRGDLVVETLTDEPDAVFAAAETGQLDNLTAAMAAATKEIDEALRN